MSCNMDNETMTTDKNRAYLGILLSKAIKSKLSMIANVEHRSMSAQAEIFLTQSVGHYLTQADGTLVDSVEHPIPQKSKRISRFKN